MKRNLITGLTLLLSFYFLPISTGLAASADYEVTFSSQPTPATQNIPIGSTLPLTYTVQSTFPTAVPLTYLSFSGSSLYTVQSITTNCSNNVIPADGACTITVNLTAGGTPGSTTSQLTAAFSNNKVVIAGSETLTINTTSMPLTFSVEPTSPQNVNTNSTLSLNYTVTNPNAAAVPFTTEHYTPSYLFTNPNNTPTVTPTSPACTSNTVPPNGGTCNFTVGINTGNADGVAFGQLTINYGSQNQLSSDPMQVNVNAPLTLTAQPTSTTLSVSNSTTLTYTVHNNTASAITLTSEAFSSSTLFSPTTPTPTDMCSGTVPASGNCNIQVLITAGTTAGDATGLQLSVGYTSGSAYTLKSSRITLQITPSASAPLFFSQTATVQNMPPSSTQTLVYTVTNTAGTAQSINSVAISGASLATTSITNGCGASIAASSSCTVTVVETSLTTPGTENQTLTVDYGSSILLTTPISFDVTAATSRNISFVNQCNYPVWVGINPASVNNTANTSTTCTTAGSQSNCPNGATCVATSPSLNQCFWVAPTLSNYQLAPLGQPGNTTSVTIASVSNPGILQGEMMNLTFAGRTGCDNPNGVCDTADCSGQDPSYPATGACKPGVGFTQPTTQMEINFYNGTEGTAYDTYDGEMINGFNVPVSATPSATPGGTDSNPYTCGVAGGNQINPALGLGNCSWNFPFSTYISPSANTPYYNWVTPGGASCSTASPTCSTAGQVCGLSFDSIQQTMAGNSPILNCGTRLGFWNPNEVCGKNPLIGAPFNCAANSGLASPFNDLNMTALYACQVPPGHNPGLLPSCYTTSPASQTNQCCGCQNWQSSPTNLTVPSNPSFVLQCPVSAASWISNVLPGIAPFKSACLSLYSYPYDDKSSTFTCNQNLPSSSQNVVNYTVTFCPAGAVGTAS